MALDPITQGALVSSGGDLVSAVGNMLVQGNQNSYHKWRERYDHMHRGMREDWEMQNKYNLPVNQVNRLLQAGINPNSGNVVSEGGTINSTPSASSPSVTSPFDGFRDIGNQLGSIVSAKKTQAETKKTESETEGQNINNEIARAFGMPTAEATLNKISEETNNFKKMNVYQDIVNSKVADRFDAEINEMRQHGKQLELDNLIKTDAYDDIVKSYGTYNAYLYAQTKLAEETTKYIPMNAQSAATASYAALLNSYTNQYLAPHSAALSDSIASLNGTKQQGEVFKNEWQSFYNDAMMGSYLFDGNTKNSLYYDRFMKDMEEIDSRIKRADWTNWKDQQEIENAIFDLENKYGTHFDFKIFGQNIHVNGKRKSRK